MQKKGRERKIEMLKRYNNESYVAIYDQRYRSDQFRKINDLFSYINLKSENFVFSGNILDFGTGTGLYWDFLNQSLDELEIFEKNEIRFLALDLALAMLDELQNKTKTNKGENTLALHTHLICGDGENLPFRDEFCSHCFAFTSLQNLADVKRGLTEIKRCLKKTPKKTLVGISYLKKKIEKNELLKMLRNNLGVPHLVEKKYDNFKHEKTEDYILFVEVDY